MPLCFSILRKGLTSEDDRKFIINFLDNLEFRMHVGMTNDSFYMEIGLRSIIIAFY
jgi:hypothetical protein